MYYGFALSIGTQIGDLYLNFFLVSLAEFPARLLPVIFAKRYFPLYDHHIGRYHCMRGVVVRFTKAPKSVRGGRIESPLFLDKGNLDGIFN